MEVKLCLRYNTKLLNYLKICHYSTYTKYVNRAESGKSNFENDFSQTHIETSSFQKFLLGLGSGFMSIADPRRGDMVAVMGESTGARAFEYIRSKMLQSEEGRKILEDKPRISSASVDLEKLKQMPEGTLGKAYSNFLERYKYSPDERLAVRFVDDFELAYVAQRYREAHDLFHTILDMPTNMLGEVTVKWVEAIQTRLPMCVTGALFGALRLAPKFTRAYSTRPNLVLDQEVADSLRNGLKPKNHPGRKEKNHVSLPDYLEQSIISVLQQNDFLQMFETALKKKQYLYGKLTPKERHESERLLKSFKNKLLERLKDKGVSDDKISKIVTKQVERYERCLTEISKPTFYDKKTSLIYLIARAPYEYACLVNIFTEISNRDPGFKPGTICDFGSGVGTVTWAASKIWKTSLTEYFTVDLSKDMNELAFSIVKPIKFRLLVRDFYQRQFLPASDVDFDVVVSAFTLSELRNFEERLLILNSLWNKSNHYLVLVENGSKEGFKIINEARDIILRQSTSQNFRCHVMAPCPHDLACPKTHDPSGKPCSFLSSYGELKINKEERVSKTPYSYVVLKKEVRNESDKQWPRIVSKVSRRHKLARCTLCTSEAKLEEIICTKAKSGADVYLCVRNSEWGDCLPLEITREEAEKQ